MLSGLCMCVCLGLGLGLWCLVGAEGVVFTGNAFHDFLQDDDGSTLTRIYRDNVGDVGVGAPFVNTGWDITEVLFNYDPIQDVAYFGNSFCFSSHFLPHFLP